MSGRLKMHDGLLQELRESPEREMRSLLNALNGGFIAPSPGGDAVRNPNTLPTGRNLFGINAEATPGVRAWDEGKALAKDHARPVLS